MEKMTLLRAKCLAKVVHTKGTGALNVQTPKVREVSLLKIQIRKAKKDEIGSQSLKKTGLQYWYKCLDNWFKKQ